MPELPEVETVRRGLDATVVGRTIAAVAVTGARTARRQPAEEVVARASGATVTGVSRHGKYLLVHLGDDDTLVVHLRMSGQLVVADAQRPIARHTHAVVSFADGGPQLRFVDPRTFGELFVVDRATLGGPCHDRLPGLGPDALGLTRRQLADVLRGRRTALKALLLDQRRLAGVGNLYADEVLWRARLHPLRQAGSLRPAEVTRLHAQLHHTLAEAVELRGSSLADAQYVDLFGAAGSFQERHGVYARTGLPCPRCGRAVVRLVVQQRGTHVCPRCQRAPSPVAG